MKFKNKAKILYNYHAQKNPELFKQTQKLIYEGTAKNNLDLKMAGCEMLLNLGISENEIINIEYEIEREL